MYEDMLFTVARLTRILMFCTIGMFFYRLYEAYSHRDVEPIEPNALKRWCVKAITITVTGIVITSLAVWILDADRIMSACIKADYAHTEKLLHEGANPNAFGGQPLLFAATRNQLDIARLLLEHGARVNSTGMNGISPLYRAASNTNVEMTRLLIAHGANVNMVNRYRTPLMAARRHMGPNDPDRYKAREIVRLLLAAGAKR